MSGQKRVRNLDRGGANTGSQICCHPQCYLKGKDLTEVDQLAPWSIGAQEFRHPGGAENLDAIGRCNLAAKMNQSCVMADMGVGEKDAIDGIPALVGDAGDFPQDRKLFLDRWCRLDEEDVLGAVIDHRQRCRTEAQVFRSGFDAAHLLATEMWNPSVLCDAQDDQLDSGGIILQAGSLAPDQQDDEKHRAERTDHRPPGPREFLAIGWTRILRNWIGAPSDCKQIGPGTSAHSVAVLSTLPLTIRTTSPPIQ